MRAQMVEGSCMDISLPRINLHWALGSVLYCSSYIAVRYRDH